MFRRRSRKARPALDSWAPEDPGMDPVYARPPEWWQQVADRRRHLTEWPGHRQFEFTPEDYGRALDEYDLEPLIWLARHGHLTPAEAECIRAAARDAAPRVGSEREQMSWYSISQDRSRVRRARAVDAALAGEPGDGPDFGIGRGRHVDAESFG